METQSALERFAALVQARDDEIDLGLGALLIAASEYPDMDIEREAALLDGLASAVERRIEDRDAEHPEPVSLRRPWFPGQRR